MLIVGCPHCGWPLVLPDLRLGIIHPCLNCDPTFATSTAHVLSRREPKANERRVATATAPVPVPLDPLARPIAGTRLTTAHHCLHCHEPLSATGMRRTDLEC